MQHETECFMKYTGTSTRASCHVYYKTRGFLILYVFYITTTPYLPYNNKNINRKELYDFYYTAISLTTGIAIQHLLAIHAHSNPEERK